MVRAKDPKAAKKMERRTKELLAGEVPINAPNRGP